MRHKIEFNDLKATLDGSGGSIPITRINISTKLSKDVDTSLTDDNINFIAETFNKISWEYILGTGHWTPTIDNLVKFSNEIIKKMTDKLYLNYSQDPVDDLILTERIYTGIMNYYYFVDLIIQRGKFKWVFRF